MTTHPRIRVVLADDHQMVRQALVRILEESGTITVVGQAADGSDVLQVVEKADAEVLVLDYGMPHQDTPRTIESVLRRSPRTRVLVLTVHENIHYAVKVLEAGAHGYLIKSSAVQELVDAIQIVRDGDVYLSPKVAQEVLRHLRRPKRDRVGLEALSPREFEVLRILGSGKSLQECARIMKISTSTASTYRARIMEKLNLQSTAEIIRFALENRIVG